jgi:hypothetical protein
VGVHALLVIRELRDKCDGPGEGTEECVESMVTVLRSARLFLKVWLDRNSIHFHRDQEISSKGAKVRNSFKVSTLCTGELRLLPSRIDERRPVAQHTLSCILRLFVQAPVHSRRFSFISSSISCRLALRNRMTISSIASPDVLSLVSPFFRGLFHRHSVPQFNI